MNKKYGFLANFALVSQIGVMMVVPIVLGVWLGNLMDNKLGTGGLFLIIFILLGVAAAFRNVYLLVYKQFEKKEDDQDESGK